MKAAAGANACCVGRAGGTGAGALLGQTTSSGQIIRPMLAKLVLSCGKAWHQLRQALAGAAAAGAGAHACCVGRAGGTGAGALLGQTTSSGQIIQPMLTMHTSALLALKPKPSK